MTSDSSLVSILLLRQELKQGDSTISHVLYGRVYISKVGSRAPFNLRLLSFQHGLGLLTSPFYGPLDTTLPLPMT